MVQMAIDIANFKSDNSLSLGNTHYVVHKNKLFLQGNDKTDYRVFVFSLQSGTPVFLYEDRTYVPNKEQFLEYDELEPFQFNFEAIPEADISVSIYSEYPTDEMTFSDIVKWEYPTVKENEILAFKYRKEYEFTNRVVNIKILCGDIYNYDPLLYVNLLRFPDVDDVIFTF